ncbi:MAG: tRNA (adenosine(37)-N6)-threonylcarbamoyltransferase complex dimerization subunit type 1 TsaB [Gammaproteobacteria bacterium]|nr:tRNA (adenosine(37)-N6)-threonylcarbamoyltransferase complex dimerization subunit type 1 TsaB [Gammaproteobacteria bacterium]
MTIPSAPFNCLAIETATDMPSLALLHGDSVTVRESRGLRAPSRSVFEWVRELLDESSVSLDELDCIAFGSGPGSFTGVRVAVAVAQGLGYAAQLPLCPVSTLAALAAGGFRHTTADTVACCLDAYMGEVYFGVYCRDARDGVRELGPDVLEVPDAVSLPGGGTCFAAGPGWAAYPQLAGRMRDRFAGIAPDLLPSATDVARLARPRFLAGRIVRPAEAQPNYLRHQVASVAKAVLAGRSV